MKRFSALIILSILTLQLNAETYSPKKAFMMSALVPGMGQKYTKNYTSMGLFLSSEIGIIFSYISFVNKRDSYEDSYKILAQTKGGSSYSGDDSYYQKMQQYMSSDDYNAKIQFDAWEYFYLYNNDYDSYEQYVQENSISPEKSWKWNSKKDWNKYHKYRNDRQNFDVYAKLAVGAILVNHIISGIDALRAARYKNKIFGKQAELFITPEFNKIGFKANYVVHF